MNNAEARQRVAHAKIIVNAIEHLNGTNTNGLT